MEGDVPELGAEPVVRAAYDHYALQTDSWIRSPMKKLYALIDKSTATEIDYAFFLDLSIQASIDDTKLDAIKVELRKPDAKSLKPFDRRRCIGKVVADLVQRQWRLDRLGRNAVFYVDQLGVGHLTADERARWNDRPYYASDFGLTDKPWLPDFIAK